MSGAKRFDCVEMKWAIQRRLAEEMAGRTPDEVARLTWERVAADPILGPFLRAVGAEPPVAPPSEPTPHARPS